METLKEYDEAVDRLAESVADRVRDYVEEMSAEGESFDRCLEAIEEQLHDYLWETIDGSREIIYYPAKIMAFCSDGAADAWQDLFSAEDLATNKYGAQSTYEEITSRVAFCALELDVRERYQVAFNDRGERRCVACDKPAQDGGTICGTIFCDSFVNCHGECRQIPTVVGCSDCDPSVKAGA
jgi:hypothetical protein